MLQYLFGAVVVGLTAADLLKYQMSIQDDTIKRPVDSISIIMTSLNEERFIENCLISLRNQVLIKEWPLNFEIILVDSGSRDRTVELARPYVDKIIYAPKGKLTARNLAIDQSMGNIIVSVDADCYYGEYWLNTLLSEFNNPNVVAVSGSTIDNDAISPILQDFVYVFDNLGRVFIYPNKMSGRNSAFYKHLFHLSGRFDESINQLDVNEMLKEEEFGFGNRLAQYGIVKYKLSASTVHLGGYRGLCRAGFNSEQCMKDKIKIERFG